MKLYLNGIELKDALVTQNKIGVYYAKGSVMWATTIDKFDNATPPTGYTKYTNGSHKNYLSQRAYDFRGLRFHKVTSDKDAKITKHYGQSVGYGVEFTCDGKTFVCAHTADHPAVGTVVKAGQKITQIASYSGIAQHLHMYCREQDLKDVVLTGTPPVTPPDCSECEDKLKAEKLAHTKTKAQLKVSEERVVKLENDIKKLETQVETLENELSVCQDKVKEQAKTIVEKNAKIGELNKEIELLKEQIANTGNWITDLFNTLWETFLKAIGQSN